MIALLTGAAGDAQLDAASARDVVFQAPSRPPRLRPRAALAHARGRRVLAGQRQVPGYTDQIASTE